MHKKSRRAEQGMWKGEQGKADRKEKRRGTRLSCSPVEYSALIAVPMGQAQVLFRSPAKRELLRRRSGG